MMRTHLEQALALGYLRRIDLHAGLFVHDLAARHKDELLLAAALASRAVGEGHICLPLDQVAGRPVFGRDIAVTAPDLVAWRKILISSGVADEPGGNSPLILDSADRLYLARYYACEIDIGEDLLGRSRGISEVDPRKAAGLLDRLFPEAVQINWQKQAAALALLKQFLLISGGPGTGKTYTVARILALLQALSEKPLRIALAAPTGKAAFRLHESISRARQSLDPELAAMVPEETRTIHRLLGVLPGSGGYRYNEGNPLHLDLLVLDEASMIDVPLMAGLVKALPATARLVMLGDKDQLTSVEAGSLFGDICALNYPAWSSSLCRRLQGLTGNSVLPATDRETLGDSIVILQESYRFNEKSGLREIAAAVRTGEQDQLNEVLENGVFPGLHFQQIGSSGLHAWLSERLYEGFQACFSAADPRAALAVLENFRVLCAVREGPAGVNRVNRTAEQILRRKGAIRGNDNWYRGRPIMIRINDYGQQLFNGDTGIVWPDEEMRLWAWFVRQDGEMQKVPLSRLPDHETAYAITVHKAQGSEFSEVLLMLPVTESRILNRELIYTGVTRARNKLTICGDHEVMAKGIARHVVRFSGLRDRLWHGTEDTGQLTENKLPA